MLKNTKTYSRLTVKLSVEKQLLVIISFSVEFFANFYEIISNLVFMKSGVYLESCIDFL